MSEHVAIVVGAGGDLGRVTAQKLAAAGFTVAGIDRSEEAIKGLPDGIRREAADSVDPAAARSVVDRIAAEVGAPEVLVNTIVHVAARPGLEPAAGVAAYAVSKAIRPWTEHGGANCHDRYV